MNLFSAVFTGLAVWSSPASAPAAADARTAQAATVEVVPNYQVTPLSETDVDPVRGSVLIRHGKGGLCRIRHRPPYVALGTMLRSAPGVEARPVDRVCAAVVGCVGEA